MDEQPPKLDYARPLEREGHPSSHRLIHASIVLACGFVGMIVMAGTVQSHGLFSGPTAFFFGFIALGLLLPLIFLFAVSFRVSSQRFKKGLAIACLAPAILIWGVCFAVDKWIESNLPYDRFRDNLANPIPPSVSDVRFVPLQEQIEPNLTLRFKIAKPDLDRIIEQKGFVRAEPGHLRNPNDHFNDSRYLRVGIDDGEFYQVRSEWGDEGTLRVNKEHTEAVFRREQFLGYK